MSGLPDLGQDGSSLVPQLALPVAEASQVGEVRRRAVALAGSLGFDETETGKVALVATEAANNLVKHAREGQVLLRSLEVNGSAGLEILALDRGPGMNPAHCLADGFSTSGTPGTGLGAIGRLAAEHAIYSERSGTVLLARLWARPQPRTRPAAPLILGAVEQPFRGEQVSGDAWACHQEPNRCLFVVADGLGHGQDAAAAAREAVRVFQQNVRQEPAAIIHWIHGALRATRGAAVAVAAVDLETRQVHFAGVGNIAAAIVWAEESRSMVSHNGTVGHQLLKVQEFVYPFPAGAVLILHTDGLTNRWRLDQYPGLLHCNPALIAAVLYKEHQRGRDDVTVVVAREGGEGGGPQ